MGKAKVFIEKYDSRAGYKVYFMDYESREKNAAIVAGGELVDYASRADVKVSVVDYVSRADICITRKNFAS